MRTRTSHKNQDRLFAALFKPAETAKKVDKRKPCAWRAGEDGVWQSNCGEAHVFIDGGPRDNNYRYCPYCGRVIANMTPNA